MTPDPKIREIIFQVIDEVNESLTDDKKIRKSADGVLYGPDGGLDSLGLTIFIVALEQKLERELGLTVSLTEGMMTAPEESPLRSMNALIEHLSCLLGKK